MRTLTTITATANDMKDLYSVILELVGLNQVFGPKDESLFIQVSHQSQNFD